nr:EVE domain-containing protein [uncultured Methanoregula sp.]
MTTLRYWIIVASEEHVMLGVNGGFAQAGHGKRSGLARMHAGDRIIYYSPKTVFGGNDPLHAFTALGEVADNEIVQVEMSPDFRPFRRKVNYQLTGEVKIEPLIQDLEFIRNKRSWGSAFRFGLLEIQKADFERIEQAFEKYGKAR